MIEHIWMTFLFVTQNQLYGATTNSLSQNQSPSRSIQLCRRGTLLRGHSTGVWERMIAHIEPWMLDLNQIEISIAQSVLSPHDRRIRDIGYLEDPRSRKANATREHYIEGHILDQLPAASTESSIVHELKFRRALEAVITLDTGTPSKTSNCVRRISYVYQWTHIWFSE